MWEKILISDRKSKKRKPTTDLITRKDTSHPAQNLKRKRRKKKGPKRFVLFSHCLHQQNYRIQRYGSLESHEKSWERGFSAQQTRWTGFFRLFLSAAASLFPRQSCLFARILTGTSLYSQGNVYTHLRDDCEWIIHRSFLLEKFLSRSLLQLFARGFETFDRQCTFSTNEVGRNNEQWGNILEKRPNKIPPRSTGQTLIFSRVKREKCGRYRKETDKLEESPSGNFVTMEYLKVPLSLSRLIDRPTTV